MTNPYAASNSQLSSNRITVVQYGAQFAKFPRLTLLAAMIAIGIYFLGLWLGAAAGLWAYILYARVITRLFTRNHARGMQMLQREQFEAAIDAFEQSYDYFSRHRWLDDYRAVVLLSDSAMSNREIALLNIAHCYLRQDDGPRMYAAYQRVLAEFPNSALATSAMRLIHLARRLPPDIDGTEPSSTKTP